MFEIEGLVPPQYATIVFLGNTLSAYATAGVSFILLLIAFKIFQMIVLGRLHALAKKTATDIDDTLIKIVRSLRPPFYSFLAFYIAIRLLSLSEFALDVFTTMLIIWAVYQIIIAIQILIDYVVQKKMGDSGGDAKAATQFLNLATKIVLWSIGLLFVLSNLGINVTSLIAALGVGGIAVAFALQNILSDLFSSFAIYFDQPFVPGDFIIVGDKMGVVERIGIKTTRIRSLQGEELVFSNRLLTDATLQNFKKMEQRRIAFSVGVTYDTPTEKLETALSHIKNAVESTEGIRFDRSHFHKFGDSALSIETVYYVETGDYNKYMDVNQELHFKIKRAFEKDSIEFAFPTQTIHLEK